MDYLDTILLGDCEDILANLPDDSIDLIFTSPPYADQRRQVYGGIHLDAYVDWFMPKAHQFQPLHDIAVDAVSYVVDLESDRAEDENQTLSLRQLFRTASKYDRFLKRHDKLLKQSIMLKASVPPAV